MHGVSYLIAKVVPAILTLVALSLYTRYLSPEEYGQYSLVMLVANVFMISLFQWLILGVGRYLPECLSENDRAELLGTVGVSVLVMSVIIILVSLIASLILSDFFEIPFYMVGLACAVLALSELSLKVLNADLQPSLYGKLLLLRSSVSLAFGWAFSYLGYGAVGVISGFILGGFLAFFVFGNFWGKLSVSQFKFFYLKKLFGYGMPLTFAYLLVFIIDVSDRFFIKYYLGVGAVGKYSASYDFTQYAIGSIAAVVHLAAFPLIINKLIQNGYEEARQQLQLTFSILISLILPLVVGLAVCSDEIGKVFFGKQFSADAAIVIPLIAIAMFFSVLKSFYFDYAFQLSGRTHKQAYSVLFAAVVNIICNMFLIPVYGILGAAVSTVIAFSSALIVSILLGFKSFPMPGINVRPVLIVIFSSALMYFAAKINISNDTNINLAFKFFISALIYVLCLVLTDFLGLRSKVFFAINKRFG